MPSYPNITIQLTGEDGNAFSILGRCTRAMRHAHLTQDQIDNFLKEATSSDYNHLIFTVTNYFDCQ